MDLSLLKAALPLPVVAREYIRLRKRGKDYVGLCPFHSEKTPSFVVHQDFYKCFGCGASGDIISLVRHIESCTFPEAVRRLCERAGIAPPEVPRNYKQMAQQSAFLARDAGWWRRGALMLLDQIAALTAEDEEPGESHRWLHILRAADDRLVIGMYQRMMAHLPEIAAMLVRVGREDREHARMCGVVIVWLLAACEPTCDKVSEPA